MTAEQLQLIAEILSDVAKTLSIIAVANCISSATDPEERAILCQMLLNLINNCQTGPRVGTTSQGPFGDRRIY